MTRDTMRGLWRYKRNLMANRARERATLGGDIRLVKPGLEHRCLVTVVVTLAKREPGCKGEPAVLAHGTLGLELNML
jgi:hypothetical protein